MKIDRLLGITTTLLQQGKVTAPELARRFEVSRRTIMRDVEAICMAGIPLVTVQGGGGGISIAEGYKLDKSALTAEELQSIIAGLKSVGSVTGGTRIEKLIAKLAPQNEAVLSIKDSILIDLSSHYKASLSEKIALIKTAIADNRLIRFDYYSERGMTGRTVEPYFIAFKWSAWYVFGYCRDREDFRLFKLNRLWRCGLAGETFLPRQIPEEELDLDRYFSDEKKLTVLFDRAVEYRLVEDYGPGSYRETGDGKLLFTVGFTNGEYLKSWVLGFGDRAKVLEPQDFAEDIKNTLKKMMAAYEQDT